MIWENCASVELLFDSIVELWWCSRVVLGFVVTVELYVCVLGELRFDSIVDLFW